MSACTDSPSPGPASQPVDAGVPDFSGIPGLSLEQTLLYLPGREALYARVLAQFMSLYQAGLDDLSARLRAGQWVQAHGHLHSLRGACAAVGADGIAAQALAMEGPLLALARGEAEADTLQAGLLDAADALARSLASLIDALRQRLAEQAARTGQAGGQPGPDQ